MEKMDGPTDGGGGGSSSMSTEDLRWKAMLAKPATRGELLHMVQLTHAVFLSHSAFGAAVVAGDDDTMRELGAKAVEDAGFILTALREMIDRWSRENG